MRHLELPYDERRTIQVKFGNLVEDEYRIEVNGREMGQMRRAELEKGLEVVV